MNSKLKALWTKFTAKTRIPTYFGIGLILAGLMVTTVFLNNSPPYEAPFGLTYTFGRHMDETEYSPGATATVPQVLEGQFLKFAVQFAETDPGFIVHVFLIPGRRAYIVDENGEYLNLTPGDLLAYSIFNDTLRYDSQGTKEKHYSWQVPQDNAYTVTFWVDPTSIANNLTATLEVTDSFSSQGPDMKGALSGFLLIGLGLILEVLVMIQIIDPALLSRQRIGPQDVLENKSNSQEMSELLQQTHSNQSFTGTPSPFRNSLLLLKSDFRQVFDSPIGVIYLPFLFLILIDRFLEVYRFWGITGSTHFSDYGSTVRAYGMSNFLFALFLLLFIVLFFLFREQDEGFHRVKVALPFRRNWYVCMKFVFVSIFALPLCLAFVGGTFILIPLRNPTIGFEPISSIFVLFLGYAVLTLTLSILAISLTLILSKTRFGILCFGGAYLLWSTYSTNIQANINPYSWENALHLQDTLFSYLSLFSLERVIEYFVLRPQTPKNVNLDIFLLYRYDTLLNILIPMGFYLLVMITCILVALKIFRRKNL
ncbi:MAG: hypothetical protein ACFFC7_16560 [Candidatus Hermodarchaeota archaeon]